MEQAIRLDHKVQCTDGRAGDVSGLVFNPNTNHLDYVIIQAGAGGAERFVPVRCVLDARQDAVMLCVSAAELGDLPLVGAVPQSPVEGTVHTNLDDLCLAREGTPVVDDQGEQLGRFRGALIDANDDIQGIFLAGQDAAMPIGRLAPEARETLIVYRVREATVGELEIGD